MCEECAQPRRTRLTNILLIVILFIMVGAMATLIARFDALLHNAYNLQQQNHVIACHIDKVVSNGVKILQCQDVPSPRR